MSNALTTGSATIARPVRDFSVDDIRNMAKALVASRLFPQAKDEASAMALMLLCQAEGLHPMQAVRRYDIIQGRPALKSDAMLSDFLSRGGRVKWERCDHEACIGHFTAPGIEGAVKVAWTVEDAKKAGLLNKDNWRGYTRQMMRARVVSEGVRMTMPEVVVGTYTPEEVQDFGTKPPAVVEVIDGPKAPAPQPSNDAPAAASMGSDQTSDIAPTAAKDSREPGADDDEVSAEADVIDAPIAAAEIAVREVFPGAYVPPGAPGREEFSDLVPVFVYRQEGGVAKNRTAHGEWVKVEDAPRRTNAQNAKLHALKAELGIDDATWKSRLVANFGKETSADLSRDEASDLIEKLEERKARHGTAADKRARQHRRAADLAQELDQQELADANK